ncbi:hypothetical protein P9265_22320 [Schinkia azotoformans]|uniref:hypothetical protein n=1 Tax=Schinkia azotoformans TaxID=1454 RepID=UPI002E216EBA|nr:hypothetical protein [Schinkia azotoformans]
MEHIDEKLLALRNERNAENKSIAGQENAEQDEQKIDIYADFIKLNGKLVPTTEMSLFGNKVKIRMPKIFQLMPPEVAALKYPSERRPNPIYTDESTSVNLAFNYTENLVDDTEMSDFQEAMVEVIKNVQPAAEFLDEGVLEIEQKLYGYLEFISPAIDGTIYNLIYLVSFEDRALLCTFNCLEEDMEIWRMVAKAMMDSLRINIKENGGVNG